MRRWIRLLCLCLCIVCPACALGDTEAQLDAIFARFSTLGASVAVFENGSITYTYQYGTRSPNGERITADTLFQVGSISKLVANIGLMQLVERQGLSLDAPLSELLEIDVTHPRWPDEPITLRQLMTHTASLRDSHLYNAALVGEGKSLEKLFGEYASFQFYAAHQPGTYREYSNFGGGLIGSLIEKLSGQTLDDYMQENVFAPLGVRAAFQPSLLGENAPFADLYRMPKKELAKRLSEDTLQLTQPDPMYHYYLTAGKLVIGAEDLCRLLIALCDGGIYENTRLLQESTVHEMTTRQNFRGSVRCESGHGLFMNIITDDEVEGRTLYGHGGRAYGMLCAAYFDPADRTGVVMLTNGCRNTSMHNGVGMLGRQVLTLCYEQIIGPDHVTENPFEVK